MATQTEYFLSTHPHGTGGVDTEVWRRCIERLAACAQACTACADACLAEPEAAELLRCVRSSLDCADICTATERVATRRAYGAAEVLPSLLDACAAACRASAEQCLQHAEHHEHCRICADTCRLCETSCVELAQALRSASQTSSAHSHSG